MMKCKIQGVSVLSKKIVFKWQKIFKDFITNLKDVLCRNILTWELKLIKYFMGPATFGGGRTKGSPCKNCQIYF